MTLVSNAGIRRGQRERTVWGWRSRAVYKARLSVIPSPPHLVGSFRSKLVIALSPTMVSRQSRSSRPRVMPGANTSTHNTRLSEAFTQLGILSIGRAGGIGRPAIYAR